MDSMLQKVQIFVGELKLGIRLTGVEA